MHDAGRRIKVTRLAPNFSMHGIRTVELNYATGGSRILRTANLQNAQEPIPSTLLSQKESYENAFKVVMQRQRTGPRRTLNSKDSYWIAADFTEGHLTWNDGDLRIHDSIDCETVRSMRERNRFVLGLGAWVGFESVRVAMQYPQSCAGESRAVRLKVNEFAFKDLFFISCIPVCFIAVARFDLSGLVLFGLLFSIIDWVAEGVSFSGFGIVVSLFLLLAGALSLMLAIVGNCAGPINVEEKMTHNFVVPSTLGVSDV